MKSTKNKILTASVLPLVMGAALAAATRHGVNPTAVARGQQPGSPNAPATPAPLRLAACNPCGAKKKGCGACNPCAAKKGCGACNPCAAKKGCGGCNPCAAKKGCGACNPCAAKKGCGGCNPCGAKSACGACNPCGGGAATSMKCAIPRLITAAACNPCAAKKGCGGCNPCAAKKGCGACNPCAAKKACNPCAAKKGCGGCNPCAAKKGCGGCNPCAAKKACSPCNPCAAKKACNPCNPCGAKNACGACNPCNPCAAGDAPELTAAEARNAYDCLVKDLVAGYAKSGLDVASYYKDWKNYSSQPYVSDTHGGRLVNNYGNALAASYNKYEEAGRMPVGALLAKDSFSVTSKGKTGPGPLFLMEKMQAGFKAESGNWRYTMVMPNGQIFGTTNGRNSGKMTFCYECHMAVAEEQDSLMFLPDEYRVR